MDWTHISDWDDAYDNRKYTPLIDQHIAGWAASAAAFRAEIAADRVRLDQPYGPAPRNRFDLFLPEGTPKGLAIFVHGGYWRNFSKDDWSHLATGPLSHGWAVAMPSYTLCPDASVPEITREVTDAIEAMAREIDGPIRLAGHSVGGHLVCRMVSANTRLKPETLDRLHHVLAISPLVDLRPMLENEWNHAYGLTETTAVSESPALLDPVQKLRLTSWVGTEERPEFLRQAALIANIWVGCGAATRLIIDDGHDHFTVVNALADPESPITTAWVSG